MKKVLKGKLFLILILIIESVLAFVINTKYIFTLDNIIKLSQSYGLYQSKFQKEDIYYSGKDIDPQYEYAPFKLGDTLKIIRIKDRFLGPFPFAFSLLSAVLLFLFSPIFLPLISILSTVFTFYLLDKYWDIDKKVNLFLFFCTPIIFLSLDYAEYTLFMLLNFWGLTLFVHNKNSQSRLILSGLVMGISVWFRLESVLFLCSLVTSYAIIYRKDKKMIYKFALPVLFYAIMVGCFVLFNYTNYENILGTRYIANQSGFLQSSFGKKVENALTLLFLGAGFKIGLFLYLPLFLFVGFYLFKHYKVIEEVYRVLLLTIVFFIVLVVSTTPNDGGHLNWGLRYFILTFMPFGILLDKFIALSQFELHHCRDIWLGFYHL